MIASSLPGLATGADGPASKPEDPPIPVLLNAPEDRDAFLKKLARPDLVILDGELYRKLRQGAEAQRPAPSPAAAVVDSVAATGEVSGDWARLVVEMKATMAVDGPSWVSIQLDGLALSEVREGEKDLPTRVWEGRSWEVELAGRGEHKVRVDLLAPVRSTAEGRRLDLPIPVAASTRIELAVPLTVADAGTGLNEPAAVIPIEGGAGARMVARLSPRPRIELAWRERADPAVKLPPLLSAQGGIDVEVERGAIRTRCSWVLGALRGSVGQLTFRVDPAEEVLDVDLDHRPVQVETRREGGRSVVSVPLGEPLRPNATRSLVFNTRRPIASTGTARVALQGYSFDQARVQTGALAIARNGPIFLNPSPGRGLRRIDPRTELPESLRARGDAALAFEFNDQPFELGLSVEPAPPRLLIENRTTVTLDPRSARLETRLTCQPSQGRTYELQVLLPRGLEFEGAGPPESVALAQEVPLDPVAGAGGNADAPRLLSIALKPQASKAESFPVHLRGRAAIDASRPVAIPLFRPQGEQAAGGRFAVLTERNVSAEAIEGPSPFRVEWDAAPADWAWPAGRPGPGAAALWLRSDDNPESLPLRVTVRPRSIRHESTLAASVDLRGADVVDEISGEVAFGVLSRLDLAIPPEVPARWEVEGVELAGRELLGQDPDGTRRYRLRLARDHVESFRIRVRYRVGLADPLGPGRESRLRLAPVRVLEGATLVQNVRVAAGPGIELRSEAAGWSAPVAPEATVAEGGPDVRIELARSDERPAPVTVFARLAPRLPLPGLVASRLWIRTVQRPEDDLATTASYWVESHDGPMTVVLPPGSRWIRARVGGREAVEGDVESVTDEEYRIRLPAPAPGGPVLVAVDYVVPAATAGAWRPPTLRDGVVQQVAWEVRLPANRAGVGTPPGWTDENEWYWDGLPFRRRPWRSPAELAQWLNGGNLRFRMDPPIEAGEQGGRHGYLFSRSGPPTALRFPVFSRFTLVLLCSGPILVVGLLVLARRPPPRALGGAMLALAFGVVALADPAATILVVQSSTLGVLLLLGAILMHWALERRGPVGPPARPLIADVPAAGSTAVEAPGLGSDDSTQIRARPANPSAVSTADHIILTQSPGGSSGNSSTANLDLR